VRWLVVAWYGVIMVKMSLDAVETQDIPGAVSITVFWWNESGPQNPILPFYLNTEAEIASEMS
jgi:hypothetical protein